MRQLFYGAARLLHEIVVILHFAHHGFAARLFGLLFLYLPVFEAGRIDRQAAVEFHCIFQAELLRNQPGQLPIHVAAHEHLVRAVRQRNDQPIPFQTNRGILQAAVQTRIAALELHHQIRIAVK